ncbi:hypothetical protein [Endozoicomonas euniceicola]|uniref:Lipoprotein n=1 Tax=Endozoicomonas euniceicola TaxID=1234143 RepID=A0ABY6GU44_9GAMM|nr:hypothetical protein [Endozoicomonas euniceicola]UYM16215.1 hypothetical protein NX720_26035 [Endozoicomonas euniceicola]
MRIINITLACILLSGCATKNDFVKNAEFNYRIPVAIVNHGTFSPNSAGGTDFQVKFYNTSNKVIKYADFEVEAYNRVGDKVPDRVSGKYVKSLRDTGPHYPGQPNFSPLKSARWANVWYSYNISCGSVKSINLTFMDGEVKYFNTNDIDYMIQNNGCRKAY